MTTPNDDLLTRLRRGEDSARHELFRLCQARLRPYFHSRLPNLGDLEDCVSEVVARAMEGIDRGHEVKVLDAWLFGIARNVLKERYEARRHDGGELPERPAAEPEPRVEVEDTADLPEVPTELEMLIGKRELWATLVGAIDGISAGLQPIMHEHVRQSREKQRLVVGDDLAAALDMPVTGLNRQLNRARKATLNAIAALVVARTCARHCPDLSARLAATLGAGQRAGRRLVLDPVQSAQVLKHAGECAVCGPRAKDAREYSKWALGPGLIGLTQDDDERRRAVIALFSRGGDVSMPSSPAAALGAVPVGLVERVRMAVTTRVASMDNVVQIVQHDPDAARRVFAVVVGGVALAATVMLGLLSDQPGGSSQAGAEESPPVAGATTSTPPAQSLAQSPVAAPATWPVSMSDTTSAVPGPRHPATPAAATSTTTTTQPTITTTTTTPPTSTTTDTERPTPPTTTTTTTPPSTTTTTPPPQARDIEIDATDADYVSFGISGEGAWRDARRVQSYRLTPGTHVLLTTPGYRIVFTVTESWTVDYDHRYDRVVSGRGTAALAIHGLPVTFDTSGTDYTDTAINGTGWRNAGPVRTLRLLPGPHYVQAPTGSVVRFQVTDDGLVDFDPALDTMVTGRNSSTLAISGLPVTFNTADTDYSNTAISGTGWRNAGPVRTLRLLPGPHYVQSPTGAVVRFQVTDAGRVQFDHAVDHLATGRDTSTLAIHGLPVTFDTSGIDYSDTAISGTGWRYAGAVRTLRLLPGPHYVQAPTGAVVRFQVTDAGRVQFDHAVDHLATGRDTSTLVIHGLPVTFDTSGIDYSDTAISGTGWRNVGPVRTLRLLPGPHYLQAPTGAVVQFQVTDAGRVQFDHAVDHLATGRDTSTLTIRGLPVTIDRSAVDYTYLAISGVGPRFDGPSYTLRLLPGPHHVQTPQLYAVRFQVTNDGRVEFDPSYDRWATGRGTSMLTISGVAITIDATATTHTGIQVSGVTGWKNPRQEQTVRLQPGKHRVVALDGRKYDFVVKDNGLIDYDPSLDSVLSGRNTATLVIRQG